MDKFFVYVGYILLVIVGLALVANCVYFIAYVPCDKVSAIGMAIVGLVVAIMGGYELVKTYKGEE